MPQSRPNTQYAKEREVTMRPLTQPQTADRRTCWRAMLALGAFGLSGLSGCSLLPSSQPAAPTPPGPDTTAGAPTSPPKRITHSAARHAKDYRKDAASHLYARHSQHIYKGRLPPMLEAVGVLNVDIDRHGAVKSLQWMRAPRHAPQVMQKIEHLVKAAAPYPVPQHMSQVTYTDVWLWHQSGKFQLDTLTEGQD